MKKILLFLLMTFVFYSFIQAQPSYSPGPDVYTCKGGAIATIVANRELNATELANTDYAFFNPSGQYYYLGIKTSDIIGGYTAYYNCHAYAWHLTEGNSNQVWINQGTNAGNISTYWSGNYACFVGCNTESAAEKIHYYSGDHSAIKSSVAGKYDSK